MVGAPFLSIPLEIHQAIAEELLTDPYRDRDYASSDFMAYRATCRATSAIIFPRYAYEEHYFWYRQLQSNNRDGEGIEQLRKRLKEYPRDRTFVLRGLLTGLCKHCLKPPARMTVQLQLQAILDNFDLSDPSIRESVKFELEVLVEPWGEDHYRALLVTVVEHSPDSRMIVHEIIDQDPVFLYNMSFCYPKLLSRLIGNNLFRARILGIVLFQRLSETLTYQVTTRLMLVSEEESSQVSSVPAAVCRYLEEAFQESADKRLFYSGWEEADQDPLRPSFKRTFGQFLQAFGTCENALVLLSGITEGLQRSEETFSERQCRIEMLQVLQEKLQA